MYPPWNGEQSEYHKRGNIELVTTLRDGAGTTENRHINSWTIAAAGCPHRLGAADVQYYTQV